jgi:hypothetical protein
MRNLKNQSRTAGIAFGGHRSLKAGDLQTVNTMV